MGAVEIRKGLSLVLAASALFLGVVGTAGGATSDGVSFPCTDAFARRVAIESGFVDAVNELARDHYADSRFWEAAQTVCADFDQDGNDEMVFSLASMGGVDPWAFFDVPQGRAGESTFSFPTITVTGGYPNHGLELVKVEGLPAIRDTRQLFHRRDAHCCPTGGKLVRVVGFREGRYRVLKSETIPAPTVHHKVPLSVSVAGTAVSRFLGQKYEETWYERNAGQLNCNRRLSFNSRKCKVSFQIGDAVWFGSVTVSVRGQAPGYRRARIHFGITRFDEYCGYVQHGPPSRCLRPEHGSTHLRF